MSAGIALVLLSCIMEPVDLEGFVNSLPKPKNPDIGVDIDYEVSDKSPGLQWSSDEGVSWAALNEGDAVTINLTAPPRTVIIQVIDQSGYAGISWYCDNPTPLTLGQGIEGANSERFVITLGTAPFTAAKIYQMAVVGMKDGQQYGTSVFIKVVN